MDKKIKIFACCILVKGFTQSTICDIQRDCFDVIPNSLYDLLKENEGLSVVEIKNKYDSSEHETIDEYLDFLISQEYIFFTDKPELFPKLNEEWDTPSVISNSIIDFDIDSSHRIEPIIAQLTQLKCQAVEIRLFSEFPFSFIKDLLESTVNSTLRSISLVMKYNASISLAEVKSLFDMPVSLTQITVHGYYGNEAKLDEELPILATNAVINDESHCGVISKYNFTSNIMLYTESQKHNNCLNRKISIDRFGFIKNCPSLNVSFGHVNSTTLIEAMNIPALKSLWNISKDQVEVCRDCEYRYVCVDCRAYKKDQTNVFSKPLKCNYDPYTGLNDV